MNEQIKELMFDAGLNSDYVEGFDSIYSKQLEKFAELIVRECADVGSKFSQAHPEDICYQIKRHFGVEE
jgi:hypothetical protein